MAGVLSVLFLGVAFVFGHAAMDSRDPEATFKTGVLACVFFFLAACAAARIG